MIEPQVAFDKLAQFETSQDLANFLHAEGIKGYRKDANICPIATFMELQTGKMVGVSEDNIEHYNQGRIDFCFENTQAMYDFVVDFDAGGFDFLAARESSEDWL